MRRTLFKLCLQIPRNQRRSQCGVCEASTMVKSDSPISVTEADAYLLDAFKEAAKIKNLVAAHREPTHKCYRHKNFRRQNNQHMLNVDLPQRIGIAVSGGVDSLAVCATLAKWVKYRSGVINSTKRSPSRIQLYAFTVNHNLRPESQSEVQKVFEWLEPLGFVVQSSEILWDRIGGKPTQSKIHSMARKERRRLLLEMCQTFKVQHLLLGHHADDQIETFIQRMVKSSGLGGLSGMKIASWLHNPHQMPPFDASLSQNSVVLLRPFLNVSHNRLVATMVEQNHSWVEDPSNTNMLYDRPRIRACRLSMSNKGNDLLTEDVIAMMKRMDCHQQYIDFKVDKILSSSVMMDDHLGYSLIHLPSFLCDGIKSNSIYYQALSRLLVACGGLEYPPNRKFLKRLYEIIVSSTNNLRKGNGNKGFIRTFGGCGCVIIPWSRSGCTVLMVRQPQSKTPSLISFQQQTIHLDKPIVWDRKFCIEMNSNSINRRDIDGKDINMSTVVRRMSPNVWSKLKKMWPELKYIQMPLPARLALPIVYIVHQSSKIMNDKVEKDVAEDICSNEILYTIENVIAVPHLNWVRPDIQAKGIKFKVSPIRSTQMHDTKDGMKLTPCAETAFKSSSVGGTPLYIQGKRTKK